MAEFGALHVVQCFIAQGTNGSILRDETKGGQGTGLKQNNDAIGFEKQ